MLVRLVKSVPSRGKAQHPTGRGKPRGNGKRKGRQRTWRSKVKRGRTDGKGAPTKGKRRAIKGAPPDPRRENDTASRN